ncbi:MAG: hypothetical protein EHM41_04905 [Chloroflexi bacterium]|nr:MAG: hypothetical protein EHM41_04905 [Chloroflexota bacterium]
MTTPEWAQALAYWIHMVATVVWIGSLAALALLVLPSIDKALNHESKAVLLEQIQHRLDPLAWFSLAVLVGTGLIQMSANPNYEGFLNIGNRWSVAILVKHLVIGGMVIVSAVITWGILPSLRRSALRIARGMESPELDSLRRRNKMMIRINLVLAVVVLGLTAVARIS